MQQGGSGGGQQDNAALNQLFQRAVSQHQAGDLQQAIKGYRQILGAAPRSAPVLTYFGAALLGLGRVGEAEQALQAALSITPQNADALGYLANAQQMRGDLDGAEQSYTRALEIRPDNATAQNNLGVLLQKRGRHAQAAERFQKAIELQPDYAQAHNNLAQSLTGSGDHEGAIAAGQKAIEIDPEMAEAHNTLGSAFSGADRWDDAIAAYQAALGLRPEFLDALKNLAVAEIIAGQPAKAVAACDWALAIDPTSVSALASKSVALSEMGELTALDDLVGLETQIRTRMLDPRPDFADMDAFNDALVEHILNHPTLTYEPAGHATRKGRHTDDLLTEPVGPFGKFEELIHAAVEDVLADLPKDSDHPVMATAPENWRLAVWSVVMEEAGHQIQHIHEQGWLSGVYYPKVPSDMGASEDDPSGWIEFGLPQDLYRVSKSPPVRLIKPEEGLLVLFPSYVFHRTVPTGSEEMRVSIAFDVIRAA